MRGTILIVHHEARIRTFARKVLERGGHTVRGADQLLLSEIERPDLLLVSWNKLGSVAESLSNLRHQDGADPIKVITLTPREEIRAAIRTLEYGADDCVMVPFTDEELSTRVDACLRRPPSTPSAEQLGAGPIIMDKGLHRVLIHDKPVALAPTEFRLMAFLLENQDRVFSRGELLRKAWGKNINAGQRTVDVHVRRLRRQLEPFGCEEMIQTIRGFGYRFSPHRNAKRPARAPAVSGKARAGAGNN